jgi:hypothetical protein
MTSGSLLTDRPIHQSNNPRVRLIMHDCKFAEIFVEGYENAVFSTGQCQNFFVARIVRPIAGPDNVMAGRLERVAHGPRDARIEE